jgi:hypothetical protein
MKASWGSRVLNSVFGSGGVRRWGVALGMVETCVGIWMPPREVTGPEGTGMRA